MSNVDLNIEDYTDKSFVVRGESTRQFKEDLKILKGRYNSRLRGGPGWIFSKRDQAKVRDALDQLRRGKRLVTEQDLIAAQARDEAYAKERATERASENHNHAPQSTYNRSKPNSDVGARLNRIEEKVDRILALIQRQSTHGGGGDVMEEVEQLNEELEDEIIEEEPRRPRRRLLGRKR